MPKVVNSYTISPYDIQQGDIALITVKIVMVREGFYRIYRGLHSNTEEVPQGSRIHNEKAVCEALFPTFTAVAKPDPY
jgi:hypothetical protein